MIPHIDPKVDYAFKRIFGSEANAPVLIDLLNAVLRPSSDRRIVSVEIVNPFNDKDQRDDKLSVVDVKARDQHRRLYNVEMQMCATPAYPERVLYYWAKIYAGQLAEGDDYEKLQATISISFLNDVLFTEVADCHFDFQLRSSRHPWLIFSDRQEMHVIELPKFRKSAEDLTDSFEGWCYFLKNAGDLDSDTLPTGMQTAAVQRTMEVLNVISKTELERERHEAAVRWERDHRSYVKMAEQAVKAADQAAKTADQAVKAAEQARKEGIVDRIHLCQRLLKVPQKPQEELLTLAIENLQAEATALEQQLIAKS